MGTYLSVPLSTLFLPLCRLPSQSLSPPNSSHIPHKNCMCCNPDFPEQTPFRPKCKKKAEKWILAAMGKREKMQNWPPKSVKNGSFLIWIQEGFTAEPPRNDSGANFQRNDSDSGSKVRVTGRKSELRTKSRRYSRADPQNLNRIAQKRAPNGVEALLQNPPLKAFLNPPKSFPIFRPNFPLLQGNRGCNACAKAWAFLATDRGFARGWFPKGWFRRMLPGLAHQNRTIAIASDFRVDGAKSPEIPQKEGLLGSEFAARNRRSLATFHRTLQSQCIIAVSCLGNRAISGVRNGHRNRKSQKSLRFRCAKLPGM